jgi:hypothetical protein
MYNAFSLTNDKKFHKCDDELKVLNEGQRIYKEYSDPTLLRYLM